LGPTTPSVASEWGAAFVRRLHELGWVEGQTVAIEYRWAEGRNEHLAENAAELVKFKVDVILTWGTPATVTARQATSVIPIVSVLLGDPVGTGLAASIARPGGNVTGLSTQETDLGAKRLEVLREVVPNLHRLAILADVGNPANVLEVEEVQAAASAFGIEISKMEIRHAEDITPAFEATKGRLDALYVTPDQLLLTNGVHINTLALGERLPTMHGNRQSVLAGGLMSYAPNFQDLFRRGADFVDKILRGTKPADIPIEQPTKFELVVNLTTAKALGLSIPPNLLVLANEVIE
jgi:putative ABC transport system substrate-binding protein